MAWDDVSDALDVVIDNISDDMREVSESLRAGNISLADWQIEMMRLIKITHTSAALVSSGGVAHMTQATWGRVGAIVKNEYQFLRNYANDIASGKQKLDGTFLRRSMLYGNQGSSTYYRLNNIAMAERGFDEERSVLNPADHCDDCVAEENKGFQPIGQMIPIGRRQCRSNCKCSVEYRNTETNETVLV